VDVGRVAGVSGRTVSRVLNGEASILPETRDRVKAAMKALDFRPNMAARALKSARSFNICLLTSHFSSFYFAEAVRGAARACTARYHHLLIEEGTDDPSFAPDDLLARLKVDGFILLPPLTDRIVLLDALDRLGTPYVRVSPAGAPGRSPAVTADEASGARALAHHLWALGHRRFGFVGGPPGHGATHERRSGFHQGLAEAGADAESIIEFSCPEEVDVPASRHRIGRSIAEVGMRAVDAFLALPKPPTAIFAFSDEIASGALARAHQLGLSVPGDLAIAGFDDSDIAVLLHPPLTTIRQPIVEMMEEAVRRLLERDGSRVSQPFEVELLVRASTDPNPRDRVED
jgi:LacI family transcriptional regulator